MRLSGKTVFITGSNRGIGKAIVEGMAAEGATVYAHARRPSREFEEYLRALSERYGTRAVPIYFDVTDTMNLKIAIKVMLKEVETIDVLVNNVGIAHGGLFMMTKIQTIREVFEVNLFSMMEITQVILPKMLRQKSGSIINLCSIAAVNVRPGNSAYGVSKAAVKAWTETLAAEVARSGIRVNAIAPSLTDTDMARQMEEKAGAEMLRASAMGRLATTKEIANVAIFLASQEASFINGQTIVVNGGGTASNGGEGNT